MIKNHNKFILSYKSLLVPWVYDHSLFFAHVRLFSGVPLRSLASRYSLASTTKVIEREIGDMLVCGSWFAVGDMGVTHYCFATTILEHNFPHKVTVSSDTFYPQETCGRYAKSAARIVSDEQIRAAWHFECEEDAMAFKMRYG